jgi:hypothetical protein
MTLTQYDTITVVGNGMNIAGSPLMGNPAFLAIHPTNIILYAISWCSDAGFQTIASNISLDFHIGVTPTTLGTITAIVNTTGQYQANLTYISPPYNLAENTGYFVNIRTSAVRTNNKAWTCILHYYQV